MRTHCWTSLLITAAVAEVTTLTVMQAASEQRRVSLARPLKIAVVEVTKLSELLFGFPQLKQATDREWAFAFSVDIPY